MTAMRLGKVLEILLSGESVTGIPFADLCKLLKKLGFDERIKGSHHIFTRPKIVEIINIQPIGSKAKPYQVRQIRKVLLKYGIRGQAQ